MYRCTVARTTLPGKFHKFSADCELRAASLCIGWTIAMITSAFDHQQTSRQPNDDRLKENDDEDATQRV